MVTSMRNLITIVAYPKIPTYSWIFALILLNWTWSCSSFLSFDAQLSNMRLTLLHGSQYVTNSSNLNDCCWLQSSSFHRWWRSRSTWLQNSMAYKRSNFSQRKINSWSLYSCVTALNIRVIYICLGLWEKKTLNKYINMGRNSDMEIPNS